MVSRVFMMAALLVSATTVTTSRAEAQDARAAPNPAAVARVRAQYLKRDAFWQARSLWKHTKNIKPAVRARSSAIPSVRQRSAACSRMIAKANPSAARSYSKPARISGVASTRGHPKPPRRAHSICAKTDVWPSMRRPTVPQRGVQRERPLPIAT